MFFRWSLPLSAGELPNSGAGDAVVAEKGVVGATGLVNTAETLPLPVLLPLPKEGVGVPNERVGVLVVCGENINGTDDDDDEDGSDDACCV